MSYISKSYFTISFVPIIAYIALSYDLFYLKRDHSGSDFVFILIAPMLLSVFVSFIGYILLFLKRDKKKDIKILIAGIIISSSTLLLVGIQSFMWYDMQSHI